MENRTLTGIERHFRDDELIVSKTDLQGRITYCNDVFMRMAGYKESELLDKPHSIVRHPDMPRCVFKLLWDTIESGKEIFAYVINRAKNGDHYWVFAHVTPDIDANGRVTGYHSNRRTVDSRVVPLVQGLYAQLLAEEARHSDRKAGIAAATAMLVQTLTAKGVSYEQFVLGL
ncbi:MAG TPA: PAS domain-containing protein [Candidatus Sulfotelmatobacter sp.]|jgi:PAS domain S-box-containing protein|nr:PAS domain-containing protein [Candidatus Sulfotelmatobacter sp.]